MMKPWPEKLFSIFDMMRWLETLPWPYDAAADVVRDTRRVPVRGACRCASAESSARSPDWPAVPISPTAGRRPAPRLGPQSSGAPATTQRPIENVIQKIIVEVFFFCALTATGLNASQSGASWWSTVGP